MIGFPAGLVGAPVRDGRARETNRTTERISIYVNVQALERSPYSTTASTAGRRQETPRAPHPRHQRRHTEPRRPCRRNVSQLDVQSRTRERPYDSREPRGTSAPLPHPHHTRRRRRRRTVAIRSDAGPYYLPAPGSQRVVSRRSGPACAPPTRCAGPPGSTSPQLDRKGFMLLRSVHRRYLCCMHTRATDRR